MLVRGSGAVLVTGSGRGIGRATAIAAAAAGFSVAVNYLQDQKAAEGDGRCDPGEGRARRGLPG
jgi:NAD(P)-dependent dehydrogenase (short-subunit alcohol dehydrogenase family)